MATFAIVEHLDVIKELLARLDSRRVAAMEDALVLQVVEAAR
jgi:hypothetical protein